jgi:hypothetical protein
MSPKPPYQVRHPEAQQLSHPSQKSVALPIVISRSCHSEAVPAQFPPPKGCNAGNAEGLSVQGIELHNL